MLFTSDWREDLRLLRLNNPSYRALFILIDAVKWGLYLAGAILLVTFCWQMIAPRDSVQPSVALEHAPGDHESAGVTAPIDSVQAAASAESQAPDQMSQERIDYLKRFASRVRLEEQSTTQVVTQVVTQNETDKPADNRLVDKVQEHRDVTVHAVVKPDKIEAIIIPATSRIATNPVLEKTAKSEFYALKPALEPALKTEAGADPGTHDRLNIDQTDADTVNEGLSAKVIASVEADTILPGATAATVVASDELFRVDALQPNPDSTDITADVQLTKVAGVAAVNTSQQVGYTGKNRAYQTSSWVLSQNRSHYTVQIGATVNRPFLLRFADNLPNEHVLALFKHRINRSNKEEYVLSYGSFSSHELANEALARLSQSNRRYGAYARSFGAIHDEMKKLQTVTAQVLSSDVSKQSSANR